MKAWYTLFMHAYNINQNSVKQFISKQIRAVYVTVTKWPTTLTICPLSEVPSLPKSISYALQMLCLKNITMIEQLRSVIEAMVGINGMDSI